jgi:hypothetical protein
MTSAALVGRSAGCSARSVMTSWSRACGTPGRREPGAGGGLAAWLAMTLVMLPVNGGRPVSIANSDLTRAMCKKLASEARIAPYVHDRSRILT